MIQELTIGVDEARLAADAIFKELTSRDGPVAVAIVDEGGNPVYVVRRDGTSAVDVRNAERKAYTAAYIGRDTSQYRLQILHDGRTVADWSNVNMTTLHGGITLRREGQVVGGLGVSGSGDEDRDEDLALRGAEAHAALAVADWLKKRDARPVRERVGPERVGR